MTTETITQPAIKGYRQLSADEAALMNEAKELGEQMRAFIEKVRAYPATPAQGRPDEPHASAKPYIDQRWVSIGATDMQRGLMAVIRGIAQPTTF